jgi:anti-sigma factor RsiW
MSELCAKVDPFADGELSPEEAEAFRDHLAECATCQAELLEILQLQALGQAARPAAAPSVGIGQVVSLGSRRRSRLAVVGAPLVAAAAALVLFVRSRPVDEPLVGAPVRSLEGRLSYAPADRFRPYDVPRAAGA